MADRSEPWAEQTVEVAGQFPPGQPPRPAFHRGVAPVGGPRSPADHDGRGGDEEHRRGYADTWPGPGDSFAPARPPMRHQLRQLRRGGEWTWIGGLFAFVCWGVWVMSVRGADMVVPTLAFVLVLLVALGVFGLARLLGRVVIERGLSRQRRSAWGAHLVTGLFLAAAGVAYLGQTEWVVETWNWLRGLA